MADTNDPQIEAGAASSLTRRRLLQAGGAGLVSFTVFPSLLAACGGDSGGNSGGGDIGGTVKWLGFEGEEGVEQTKAWLSEHGVNIEVSAMSAQDDILNSLSIGKPFDIVAPFNGFISVLNDAGLLQPFDLDQVPNFEDLFPVLKDAEFIRGNDGEILAVPIVWGDGPYIYATDKVPQQPPESVLGLAEGAWKDQLVWLDDPYTSIHGFARALGFENPTELTREQLDQVVEAAKPVMANVVSFAASFGDATDYLVRGEASLAPIGWRVMVSEGADRGAKLEAGAFSDLGVAFCDCYSIPAEADNVATAVAYTNEVISPDANAALASALQSGAVTVPAFEKLSAEDQELYDYDLVKDPDYPVKIVNSLPPSEPEDGIMGSDDWQEAWNQLKS